MTDLDALIASAKQAAATMPRVCVAGVLDEDPRQLPCCLCGETMEHRAVYGENVRLVFRAVEVDGMIWLPVRHGGARTGCPDPPKETIAWWKDDEKRNQWKASQRMHRR